MQLGIGFQKLSLRYLQPNIPAATVSPQTNLFSTHLVHNTYKNTWQKCRFPPPPHPCIRAVPGTKRCSTQRWHFVTRFQGHRGVRFGVECDDTGEVFPNLDSVIGAFHSACLALLPPTAATGNLQKPQKTSQKPQKTSQKPLEPPEGTDSAWRGHREPGG